MLGGAMWLDLANGFWIDYLVNTFGKLAIYVEKDKSFFMPLPKIKCRWVKEVKKKISNVKTLKKVYNNSWYWRRISSSICLCFKTQIYKDKIYLQQKT